MLFDFKQDLPPYLYGGGFTLSTGLLLKAMFNLNFTSAQSVLETIVAGLAVASAIGAGLLKLRNHVRRVTSALDAFNTLPLESLAKLPDQFETLQTDVQDMKYQLSPNGGRSVSDRVDKLTAGQQQTHEVLRTLSEHVAALARKQQAGFHLSDRCLLEFDSDGRCIFANRAFLRFTGRTEADIMGTGWTSSFHPDDRREVARSWETAVTSKSSLELGARMARANGEYARGSVQMTAVHASGELVAWLGVFTPNPVMPDAAHVGVAVRS